MSIRSQIGTFALALTLGLGLTSGCGATSADESHGDRTQADVSSYISKLPNGPGLYIQNSKGAPNYHGISTPEGWFYMTHFTNGAPEIQIHGAYVAGGSLEHRTGRVLNAEVAGTSYAVKEVTAKGSDFQLILLDPMSGPDLVLSGDKLSDVRVHVLLPIAGKASTSRSSDRSYSLYFKSVEAVDSVTKDIYGFNLYTQMDNVPGAPMVPYCSRTDLGGSNEPAQFTPGSSWDMPTSARADNKMVVNISCISGAIGTCQRWGYRPWEKAELLASGTVMDLNEPHQACIYMKRADYCATGDTYTEDGTMIGINDAFNPAFQKSGGSSREAVWGKKGAICLDTQRHHDMPIPAGCAVTLPPCTAASYTSDWYVESQVL